MIRTAPGSTAADRPVPNVEDDPTDDDIAAVDDALAAFTVAAAGQDAPKPLAVFARHDDTVVAGIHGWTWGGCCELVSLWVNEPMRRRGLGRALLTAAEDRARARGCHQVVLFTHAFQTPGLYTRSGYDIVGEVEDYPAGSAAYWFRKRLDTQPGDPGREAQAADYRNRQADACEVGRQTVHGARGAAPASTRSEDRDGSNDR